jgi:hypothetical protein
LVGWPGLLADVAAVVQGAATAVSHHLFVKSAILYGLKAQKRQSRLSVKSDLSPG